MNFKAAQRAIGLTLGPQLYLATDQFNDGIGLEVDVAVEREQKRVPGSDVLLGLGQGLVALQIVAWLNRNMTINIV